MSPVVEPPSATGLTSGITGSTLYSQLSTVFGYLNSAGFCSAGSVCKRFPILLEIGSALKTLDDTLFMNDLANYMTVNGLGTMPHQHACCPWLQAMDMLACISMLRSQRLCSGNL